MRNRSSYAETYGKDAAADHESSILTFKNFKDLPYVSVLNSGREIIHGRSSKYCKNSGTKNKFRRASEVKTSTFESSPTGRFNDHHANSAINLIQNDSKAKEYIERWLKTAKDTYYKDLLMKILKAVYVHVNSKQPSQSLYKNNFHQINRQEIQKPPRIDKLNVRKFDPPGEEER